MIGIDVPQLHVYDRVDLDSEYVIAGVALVLGVEDAEILKRKSGREIHALGNTEGHALAGSVVGVDGKHKGDSKRFHRAVGGFAEAQRSGVEGMAFEPLVGIS
jgi:hypothetical protein